ncbi:Capsular polysaccharide biosynthesis glycosyltransferase CapM [Porphyridium purpureum]|uniref:Capsular polysaccharide biosynthesis glycosyltransferase CapM n=1 Tax=Porphyridium purpureum TaxID=35688 RepID=A0A5J4YVK5_PORPP|nr:Capsular polysaccharide biosynthesis glycosyltransferase CapM [Porphyridium purpureum]|eukprot:POR9558..scf209_3
MAGVSELMSRDLDLPAGVDPYEEFDFQPYFQEVKSEDELRRTWRVFTKVKDVLDNGRRLENASWRMWFKERVRGGALPDDIDETQLSEFEKFDMDLDKSLKQAQESTSRMVGDMFGVEDTKKFETEKKRLDERNMAERTRSLMEIKEKYSMPDEAFNDLLSWIQLDLLSAPEITLDEGVAVLPADLEGAKELLVKEDLKPRKRCAAFGHSLERNGANNFLLYLVRELREELAFTVVAPKDGPMRDDYESMGVPVQLADMKAETYPQDIRALLDGFDFAIANTIMTTEVIIAGKELGIPTLWVIHEAWPQDQFEYYAKEVFLMSHLDADKIRQSFAEATRIVFPAVIQQHCYDGLYQESAVRVIYNGIPLGALNAYRSVSSRKQVRKELGYGENDYVIVQLGTVCKRKGQIVTAEAFANLIKKDSVKGMQPKLLMVGARYIRQHEIEYIDAIKAQLAATGADAHTTILDVKKNVLPYYLAADIVLCPSLNEVLPLVICEAMAFERPVIASKIDGIPEALTDSQEGYLIPPGDAAALEEKIVALANPELRKTMGVAGRKRVLSQFSFSVMAQAYRSAIFGAMEEART